MREIIFRYKYTDGLNWIFKTFKLNEIINGYPFDEISDSPLLKNYVMVGQADEFTGLLDKNGIEIYEGDVIKSINYLAVVVWVKDYACFGIEYIGGGGINTVIDNINGEIKGNIYYNPELLK